MFLKQSILALVLLIPTLVSAESKFLYYKYSDTVILAISNINCPYDNIKTEYQYGAFAYRIDGDKLSGCFKKLNNDEIQIQWYKGDTTVLPVNVFLQKNIEVKQIEM